MSTNRSRSTLSTEVRPLKKGDSTYCKRCGGPLRVMSVDKKMLRVGLTRRQARTILVALRFAGQHELDPARQLRYKAACAVFQEWVGKEQKYE